MAFIWAPLAATATRNLPPHLAGAGSGVYNAIRQLGAVLGSAGMAAFMASRIGDEMPAAAGRRCRERGAVLKLPAFLHEPFAAALSQSVLLPAFVALFGIIAALFLVGFAPLAMAGGPPQVGDVVDDDYDDDEYVEFILLREPEPAPAARAAHGHESGASPADDRVARPRPAPADVSHSLREDPIPRRGPIGFAHNGSHVDTRQRFRPVTELSARAYGGAPRDRLAPPAERQQNGSARGQRPRRDPDEDPTGYGRHSSGN